MRGNTAVAIKYPETNAPAAINDVQGPHVLFEASAYGEASDHLSPPAASEVIPQHERCLSDIDLLNRMRQPDGNHAAATLEGVHTDLRTGAMEAAMPYAVSTVHQEYVNREFMWLDQTATDVARSGYKFHKHPNAILRVHVEVEEALDVSRNLRPGMIKVFLSPRMTRQDATLKEAEAEHLAYEDMIRIHMLSTDEVGRVTGKYMQSILVRDVPLEAWRAMLHDPGSLFGRSIDMADTGSALDVMRTHAQLELPAAQLPEGVVTLVEAVIPYISDAAKRKKVLTHLNLFRTNQDKMQQTAESIASRWLSFEVALADSLHQGFATPDIEQFVRDLDGEWGDDMRFMLIAQRQPDGSLRMTRQLAAKLEQARQNTLWVAAAVATGNEKIIRKLGKANAQKIYANEMVVQQMLHSGYTAAQVRGVEVQNSVLVAQSGVSAGGGCAGKTKGDFKRSGNETSNIDTSWISSPEAADAQEKKGDNKELEWELGVCRIESCGTRPGITWVGPCSICESCQERFDNGEDPTLDDVPKEVVEKIDGNALEIYLKQFAALREAQGSDRPPKKTGVHAGSLALVGANN